MNFSGWNIAKINWNSLSITIIQNVRKHGNCRLIPTQRIYAIVSHSQSSTTHEIIILLSRWDEVADSVHDVVVTCHFFWFHWEARSGSNLYQNMTKVGGNEAHGCPLLKSIKIHSISDVVMALIKKLQTHRFMVFSFYFLYMKPNGENIWMGFPPQHISIRRWCLEDPATNECEMPPIGAKAISRIPPQKSHPFIWSNAWTPFTFGKNNIRNNM